MSYSFEGYFKSASDAYKAVGAQEHLPSAVRAVLLQAISGIADHYQLVYVRANGHQLCDEPGGGSYERSSADLVVEPLLVYDETTRV